MTDKKKGIPTPKTKALTKSQKKLLDKNKADIEVMTREIFNYILERINRLGTQVITGLIEDFAEELELSDEWAFDTIKAQFRKDN